MAEQRTLPRVKGRKRHLVADTLGLLTAVPITSSSTRDRDAALPAVDVAKARVPGLGLPYVDSAYAGVLAPKDRR